MTENGNVSDMWNNGNLITVMLLHFVTFIRPSIRKNVNAPRKQKNISVTDYFHQSGEMKFLVIVFNRPIFLPATEIVRIVLFNLIVFLFKI